MIRLVSWNIDKQMRPWRVLTEMACWGAADVALLQEAKSPLADLGHLVQYEHDTF